MHVQEPALARALGGRLQGYAVLSVAALGTTAVFAMLAQGGWEPVQALLGAVIAGCAVLLGAIAVQRRRQPGRDAP
jgi:hypothetical protein